MPKGQPDRHYQRFKSSRCMCRNEAHGHRVPCDSRRYLVVHHEDHARQNQGVENLVTLCSSCHRKEHAQQAHYYGRAEHHTWASEARGAMQKELLRKAAEAGEAEEEREAA